MKCRTEKLREELVAIYDLSPVAHVKLLNGQTKVSCTGDLLTDSYYCFTYKRKNSNEPIKSFFSGSHASNHFLKLVELEPLVCFNPLKIENSSNPIGGKGGNLKNEKWNSTAKELYNAINLLIVFWGIAPLGPLLDIKIKLEKYYYKEPFDSTIKSINTIISKSNKCNTMPLIIASLEEFGIIKKYLFERINLRLDELNIQSYF